MSLITVREVAGIPTHIPRLLLSPMEAESMARRMHQDGKLQTRVGTKGPEWYIRYRITVLEKVDGKPTMVRKERWHHLGLKKEMTEAQAKRERDKVMREVNGQIYTIQSHVPFEDFLDVYRETHYRSLSPRSVSNYEGRITQWILPALKGKKMYQISETDLNRLMAAMEAAGVARKTRQVTKAILKGIFALALRWGYLPKGERNPAAEVEIGRTPGATRTRWTPTMEEAERIIAGAPDDIALALELIVWTGMRISEVLGLRWSAFNFEAGEAAVTEQRVRGALSDTKSNAGRRTLPLGSLAEKFAARAPKPDCVDDFVFTTASFHNRLLRVLTKAGVYEVGNGWHAFRRLHLTMMSKRLSLFDLLRQAGHTNVKTTALYVTDDMAARRDAVKDAQKVVPIRRKA